jgi:hypothetical protein
LFEYNQLKFNLPSETVPVIVPTDGTGVTLIVTLSSGPTFPEVSFGFIVNVADEIDGIVFVVNVLAVVVPINDPE